MEIIPKVILYLLAQQFYEEKWFYYKLFYT